MTILSIAGWHACRRRGGRPRRDRFTFASMRSPKVSSIERDGRASRCVLSAADTETTPVTAEAQAESTYADSLPQNRTVRPSLGLRVSVTRYFRAEGADGWLVIKKVGNVSALSDIKKILRDSVSNAART